MGRAIIMIKIEAILEVIPMKISALILALALLLTGCAAPAQQEVIPVEDIPVQEDTEAGTEAEAEISAEIEPPLPPEIVEFASMYERLELDGALPMTAESSWIEDETDTVELSAEDAQRIADLLSGRELDSETPACETDLTISSGDLQLLISTGAGCLTAVSGGATELSDWDVFELCEILEPYGMVFERTGMPEPVDAAEIEIPGATEYEAQSTSTVNPDEIEIPRSCEMTDIDLNMAPEEAE